MLRLYLQAAGHFFFRIGRNKDILTLDELISFAVIGGKDRNITERPITSPQHSDTNACVSGKLILVHNSNDEFLPV